MTFSNSLPVVDKRLIGLRFCGIFGFFPGFGKVIIFVSFQEHRKYDSLRHWLNNVLNEPEVFLEGA
jgi:hypothetical protein